MLLLQGQGVLVFPPEEQFPLLWDEEHGKRRVLRCEVGDGMLEVFMKAVITAAAGTLVGTCVV